MSIALSRRPVGTTAVAGGPLHEPITVTLTGPSTPITALPVTATWNFSQPQGDTQAQYRVRVTNDADTSTLYDTNWIDSADASFVIPWDSVGVGESSDVTIHVHARSVKDTLEGRQEDTDSAAMVIELGQPHLTITQPLQGEIWTDGAGVDLTWTYNDDRAIAQKDFRPRLLDQVGQVLYDGGWIPGTDLTYRIPYVMNNGWTITVEVQARNLNDIPSD